MVLAALVGFFACVSLSILTLKKLQMNIDEIYGNVDNGTQLR